MKELFLGEKFCLKKQSKTSQMYILFTPRKNH